MISRVKIENYKSLESVGFPTTRVNVFIGEPNSGKSNLLEAIGWLSPRVPPLAKELFRVELAAELFFDREIERKVSVQLQGLGSWDLAFARASNDFRGRLVLAGSESIIQLNPSAGLRSFHTDSSPVRYYSYRRSQPQANEPYAGLMPPYGQNLTNLLYTNKAVRESISAFFKSRGHRLELRPQTNEILMSKEVDDVLYSFSFDAISETMRRIVFYKAALESNTDAVLVLDEPEANTFPFYTKYLAERIALDTTNQFFLTTHNPYVLMSIIEKTPSNELSVFATRMYNFRTEVSRLDDQACAKALDLGMDLFFNLDEFFPE